MDEVYAMYVEKKKIKIYEPSDITLVQTDKPLYKPGETVKFRALTMNHEMNIKLEGVRFSIVVCNFTGLLNIPIT